LVSKRTNLRTGRPFYDNYGAATGKKKSLQQKNHTAQGNRLLAKEVTAVEFRQLIQT